jgi:hypothetical protein
MESDNKLLIRIDERQKQVANDIVEIKDSLKCTVKDDDDFKDLKNKVKTLWDERNKVIGWLLACGIVGGTTGALIKNFVASVFAK